MGEFLHSADAAWRRRSGVLVISSDAALCRRVETLCEASNWHGASARGWRDAGFVLSRITVDVILCDDTLADGTWKDVLSVIAPMAEPPRVVVMFDTASADAWAEVMNFGGFDVLTKPLQDGAVSRTVAAARRSAEHETEERRKRKSSRAAGF